MASRNSSLEMVASCGSWGSWRLALRRLEGPVEAALAGDDHPLGDVAEHGVGGALEGAPGARAAGGPALPPHDLAPQQQAEVLEDLGDVAGQRAVGATAEVGHVDGDAAARLEHPLALGEDPLEHGEVLEVVGGHAVLAQALLVGLAREVGRRRDDQRHRVRLQVLELADVAAVDGVDHGGVVELDGVVGRELGSHEAVVEARGVVALAPRRAEVGGGGGALAAAGPGRRAGGRGGRRCGHGATSSTGGSWSR